MRVSFALDGLVTIKEFALHPKRKLMILINAKNIAFLFMVKPIRLSFVIELFNKKIDFMGSCFDCFVTYYVNADNEHQHTIILGI